MVIRASVVRLYVTSAMTSMGKLFIEQYRKFVPREFGRDVAGIWKWFYFRLQTCTCGGAQEKEVLAFRRVIGFLDGYQFFVNFLARAKRNAFPLHVFLVN